MIRKIFKFIGIALLSVSVLGTAGFIGWAETPAAPGAAALSALASDAQVTVTDEGDYILFMPANAQPTTGFLFYPGGRVDYRAYAPALRLIAMQGYAVALVPVTLNLAFFDIDAGAPVLETYPDIAWAVGGHSLGGVAASLFAAQRPEVRGIVYWASYPADDALKNAGLPTLSIYGTLDGLSTPETVETNKALLPADAVYVAIEGGNHAQFGDYGLQAGDNAATIAPDVQWNQVANATVEFLASLNP